MRFLKKLIIIAGIILCLVFLWIYVKVREDINPSETDMVSKSNDITEIRADQNTPNTKTEEEKEQVYFQYLCSFIKDSLETFEEVDLAEVTIDYDGEKMVFSGLLNLNSSLSEEKLESIKSRIKEAFTEYDLKDQDIKIETNM